MNANRNVPSINIGIGIGLSPAALRDFTPDSRAEVSLRLF